MENQEKIKQAKIVINYLKRNRYIKISELNQNTETGKAFLLYMQEETIRELVAGFLYDEAIVSDNGEIIAYEPKIGKPEAYTKLEALNELGLPSGKGERVNRDKYNLFAITAGIVLPKLLYAQEDNSGNLIANETTLTAWLNTIKDTLKQDKTTESQNVLAFINELGNQEDDHKKRKDLKILDKVLQKWFVTPKFVVFDGQNIIPLEHFKFVLESLLESSGDTDSGYAEVVDEMLADLFEDDADEPADD